MSLTTTSVALCLACSASLPSQRKHEKIFFTPCCSRPICPTCVASNPRLTRYNPCLRCLAGVNAVSTNQTKPTSDHSSSARPNVDASLRDEDIFVVEDSESSDDE
ncbi:hypothetical protein FKP32DRAFT_1631530, partial [Trametes sanguinea]